jgi:hypothetical protein
MATLFGLKGGIIAAAAVVALICLAIISRNWSCRPHKPPRPPRPPRIEEFDVLGVVNGATITVDSRRHDTVQLADVAAPAEGEPGFAESRDNLAKIAGQRIRVEVHGRLRAAVTDEDTGLTANGYQPLAGRPHVVVGVVYGESGLLLNLSQAAGAFIRCLPSAPAEWKAAEAAARKAKKKPGSKP